MIFDVREDEDITEIIITEDIRIILLADNNIEICDLNRASNLKISDIDIDNLITGLNKVKSIHKGE